MRTGARRVPGIGDHVSLCGGYIGVIVDVQPGGLVTVAKRWRAKSPAGWIVRETDILVDTLEVSLLTPIAACEKVDPEWRRGALG